MFESMHVRKLLISELDWANDRYAEIDFVTSTESDLIAVAEVNGTKAGLGRISAVSQNIGELGGIVVLPAFRGLSLAKHVINYLLEQSESATLFCIPFAHLTDLYQSFGFQPVRLTTPVPDRVAEKFQWCQAHYDSPVILLSRYHSNI